MLSSFSCADSCLWMTVNSACYTADWGKILLSIITLCLHVSLTLFKSYLLCMLMCSLLQMMLSLTSFMSFHHLFQILSPPFSLLFFSFVPFLFCALQACMCVCVCSAMRMRWKPGGIKSSLGFFRSVGGLMVSTEPWSDGSGPLWDSASGIQQHRQPRHVWTLVLFN